jgi:hypothetical protein
MPLRDHFHPPIFPQRPWESFHSRLANSIADRLNETLPRRFIADVQTHLGSQVEADVVEFDRLDEDEWSEEIRNGPEGGLAVQTWAPPVATLNMPVEFPDVFEVQVCDERDDMRLVTVVELVSPGNKDRPETRLAFASKTVAYLQRGIGLLVVDIVSSGQFNLHNELLPRLNVDSRFEMRDDPPVYVVAYRPIHRENANIIEAWPAALSIGTVLPLVPLWLRRFRAVPLDLEVIYEDARRRSRL